MFYLKEEKEILGRYFKYIRIRRNINVAEIYKKRICGHTTFYELEEGIAKLNDELYDAFIIQYKLSYKINNQKFLTLLQCIDELYDSCESLNQETIKNAITKCVDFLSDMKEYSLYADFFKCLSWIENYYVKNNLSTKQELLEMFPYIQIWNNKLSSLIQEIIEINNRNHLLDQEIFRMLKPVYNEKDAISQYWSAKNNKNENNYTLSLDKYKELIKYYQNKNNAKRLCKIEFSLFNIYKEIDLKKAEEYSKELIKIADNKDVSDSMRSTIYYNLGMYYYLNGVYSQALSCFENTYFIKPREKTLLFICACERRMGISIRKMEIDENHALHPYLKYFQMYSLNYSEMELETYILKTLVKEMKTDHFYLPFWEMFNHEIKELSKITKNYSNVVKYQEKMELSVKGAV